MPSRPDAARGVFGASGWRPQSYASAQRFRAPKPGTGQPCADGTSVAPRPRAMRVEGDSAAGAAYDGAARAAGVKHTGDAASAFLALLSLAQLGAPIDGAASDDAGDAAEGDVSAHDAGAGDAAGDVVVTLSSALASATGGVVAGDANASAVGATGASVTDGAGQGAAASVLDGDVASGAVGPGAGPSSAATNATAATANANSALDGATSPSNGTSGAGAAGATGGSSTAPESGEAASAAQQGSASQGAAAATHTRGGHADLIGAAHEAGASVEQTNAATSRAAETGGKPPEAGSRASASTSHASEAIVAAARDARARAAHATARDEHTDASPWDEGAGSAQQDGNPFASTVRDALERTGLDPAGDASATQPAPAAERTRTDGLAAPRDATRAEAEVVRARATGFSTGSASLPSWIERLASADGIASARRGRVLQLELEPSGLGRVEVRLSVGREGVRATVLAEHEHTRALLSSQQPQLAAALERNDVRLESFLVDLGLGGDAPGGSWREAGDAESFAEIGMVHVPAPEAAPVETEQVARGLLSVRA